MSKSYNNTLAVFEDAKAQRKQIMRIVTDSRPMDQPKEPAGDVLYDLYSLVAPDADREAMAALYRRGGFGYGEIKKALADAAEKFWAEPRARRRGTGGQSRPHPRNPCRWTRQSPQKSGRSPEAGPRCVRHCTKLNREGRHK